MSEETFALVEHSTIGKPDLPKPPADIEGQLAWLKAMAEEQERLKKIEAQFKTKFRVTGNTPENAALLKEFLPHEDRFDYSGINEDISMPRALWYMDGSWSTEGIQQHHEDVKRMFPNATFKKITFRNGATGFAYTGMPTDAMASAVELVRKERYIKEAIAEQSEKLVKTSPTAHKHPTTEGIQILPTPATKSNKSTGGIPVKKGFQVV